MHECGGMAGVKVLSFVFFWVLKAWPEHVCKTDWLVMDQPRTL